MECVQEFWLGFVRNLPGTVHFVQFAGENTHHILEACFKGRAARWPRPSASTLPTGMRSPPRKDCWYDRNG